MKNYGQVKGRKWANTQPIAKPKRRENVRVNVKGYVHLEDDEYGRMWCPSCKTYKDPGEFYKGVRKCTRCETCRKANREWKKKRGNR